MARIVDEQMSAALGDADEPTLRIFAGPSAEAARACADCSLGTMSRFGDEPALEAERVRQAEVLDLLRTGTPLEGIRHGDQAFGRAVAAQVLSEADQYSSRTLESSRCRVACRGWSTRRR